MTERLTPAKALVELAAAEGAESIELFRHGSALLKVFKPIDTDVQKPHTRDELYVVISGSGQFVNGNECNPFQAGEVLFVPAGVEHRFEAFTPDFATWVIFFGPEGGEAAG